MLTKDMLAVTCHSHCQYKQAFVSTVIQLEAVLQKDLCKFSTHWDHSADGGT